MGLRGLVYRLYERRLEAALSPQAIPRHVGVMCDGNRRWARSAGLADVSSGHQAGAEKIFELLEWCQDAGVEVVTLWLLSTDNLARPGTELEPLLRIIEGTVRELVTQDWHVKPVGALDLLPSDTAQVRSGRCSRTTPPGAPRSRSWPRSWTWTISPSISTPPASRTRTWSSGPRASSASAVSCSGRARTPSSTSATPTGLPSGVSISCARCAPTAPGIAGSVREQLVTVLPPSAPLRYGLN
jgi:hypothetical protein